MSAWTPASLNSLVDLTSEMVQIKQHCVGETHARGSRKRKSFGTLQNCRQPQNNKLDILKFFSLSSQFFPPSIQSGTNNRLGINSDHVSRVLLQLGSLCLNPFTDVPCGCQHGFQGPVGTPGGLQFKSMSSSYMFCFH